MHIKSRLKKHRFSPWFSWLWGMTGIVVFGLILRTYFLSALTEQFGDDIFPVVPLIAGSSLSYCIVGSVLFSGRRLPYSNTYENLFTISFSSVCALLLLLAAFRMFYSGTYLGTFLLFTLAWYGLEIYFRNTFVLYRFALFPASFPIKPEDFTEYQVVIPSGDGRIAVDVDAAVVDFSVELDREWENRLAGFRRAGIPVISFATFVENALGRIPPELAGAFAIPGAEFSLDFYKRIVKPCGEWLAALSALVALSPILAITAVMVKATSKGSVFYCQERMGLNGQPFTVYKYRTMLEGMDRFGVFTPTANDARLTNIGNFLRKYHLDELPQLLNVLKGEMAIVGPRPEAMETAKAFSREIPHYDLRNSVRPGVTSWALIHQGNVSGIEATRMKLSYDLFYVKHASWFLDLYIVLKTIWIIIFGVETLDRPDGLRLFGQFRK